MYLHNIYTVVFISSYSPHDYLLYFKICFYRLFYNNMNSQNIYQICISVFPYLPWLPQVLFYNIEIALIEVIWGAVRLFFFFCTKQRNWEMSHKMRDCNDSRLRRHNLFWGMEKIIYICSIYVTYMAFLKLPLSDRSVLALGTPEWTRWAWWALPS